MKIILLLALSIVSHSVLSQTKQEATLKKCNSSCDISTTGTPSSQINMQGIHWPTVMVSSLLNCENHAKAKKQDLINEIVACKHGPGQFTLSCSGSFGGTANPADAIEPASAFIMVQSQASCVALDKPRQKSNIKN